MREGISQVLSICFRYISIFLLKSDSESNICTLTILTETNVNIGHIIQMEDLSRPINAMNGQFNTISEMFLVSNEMLRSNVDKIEMSSFISNSKFKCQFPSYFLDSLFTRWKFKLYLF